MQFSNRLLISSVNSVCSALNRIPYTLCILSLIKILNQFNTEIVFNIRYMALQNSTSLGLWMAFDSAYFTLINNEVCDRVSRLQLITWSSVDSIALIFRMLICSVDKLASYFLMLADESRMLQIDLKFLPENIVHLVRNIHDGSYHFYHVEHGIQSYAHVTIVISPISSSRIHPFSFSNSLCIQSLSWSCCICNQESIQDVKNSGQCFRGKVAQQTLWSELISEMWGMRFWIQSSMCSIFFSPWISVHGLLKRLNRAF